MSATRGRCRRLWAASESTTSSLVYLSRGHTTPTTAAPRGYATAPDAAVRRGRVATPDGALRRGYATVAGDAASSEPPEEPSWPRPPSGHAHPTPYQILATQQTEPYSKRRFYELVKFYHPDGVCKHQHHSVSHSLRLERYRLIVAAHAILSDPTKRKAYDRWGAGWGGVPTAMGGGTGSGSGSGSGSATETPPGPFSGWQHRSSDPNIWGNATWEDWERFYQRRDGRAPTQGPLYLSNANFILCVFLLATVGASLNLSRADTEGEKVVAARDLVHDRASKELRRVRQQSEARPKDERIQFFLRNREATLTGVGLDKIREEKIDKLLPERDTCLGVDPSGGEE